mgnify:CR=1 FL=1
MAHKKLRRQSFRARSKKDQLQFHQHVVCMLLFTCKEVLRAELNILYL